MSVSQGRVPVLAVEGVSKHFGSVAALRAADVEVFPGEILGIVGDNGAGKSTLLKMLSGIHAPTEGRITVAGETVHFSSPADARKAGISTVQQDLALVEVLDVATNLHLGDFPRRGLLVDRKKMERDATDLLKRLNVRVASVLTPVGSLSGDRGRSSRSAAQSASSTHRSFFSMSRRPPWASRRLPTSERSSRTCALRARQSS